MARPVPEINAGSMADIAFLLLIFFLVTTTMDSDWGIARLLPQWEDPKDQKPVDIKKRNILVVNINFRNELQVAGEIIPLSQLKEKTEHFIENPDNDPNLPEKKVENVDYFGPYPVSKGIISLTNDNGTSYNMYVSVQNELTAAINELRDKLAMSKFGKTYDNLPDKEQEAVKKIYPMAISEAEPKNAEGTN